MSEEIMILTGESDVVEESPDPFPEDALLTLDGRVPLDGCDDLAERMMGGLERE